MFEVISEMLTFFLLKFSVRCCKVTLSSIEIKEILHFWSGMIKPKLKLELVLRKIFHVYMLFKSRILIDLCKYHFLVIKSDWKKTIIKIKLNTFQTHFQPWRRNQHKNLFTNQISVVVWRGRYCLAVMHQVVKWWILGLTPALIAGAIDNNCFRQPSTNFWAPVVSVSSLTALKWSKTLTVITL